jgi:CheY-like chemotaxis protein
VADDGDGIPAAMLPRIFEPFVTTKSPGQGTGLGLYLCHNIMHSFGGDITVDSGPAGTRFHLDFEASEAATAQVGETASPAVSSRLSILVIDDETSIREVLARVLEAHTVQLVDSGRSAIATLADATFDLILCDLMMPDQTGMDVHAWVAEHRPELLDRMVFLSGGAFTDAAARFLANPALRRISKPFVPDDVLRILPEFEPATTSRSAPEPTIPA